jgi:hypothetical protein
LCSQVLTIGVTYDEFWHGDPEIVKFAIASNTIKQRNDAIQNDVQAWNTGRYVMLAVSAVLSHAFSKSSSAKYPSEPIIAYELDEQLKAQKKERELRKMHADFLAVAAALSLQKPTGAST